MKVNLGRHGKVIGTKRVDASGKVAGLKDLAGKSVLIAVPKGRAVIQHTLGERAAEARKQIQARVDDLPQELRRFRTLVEEPAARVRQAVADLTPAKARDALVEAQGWLEAHAHDLEKRAEASARRLRGQARARIDDVGTKLAAARAAVEKRLVPLMALI